MWALLFLFLQVLFIYVGLRGTRHAGLKFLAALAFGLLECTIFIAPVRYMDTESKYFPWLYLAIVTVGLLNIVLFIIVARRWTLYIDRTDVPTHQGK
jgi:hypothetical protein